MRRPVTARNLSRMGSAVIFLYEQQRLKPNAKKNLPDWQRQNHRQPNPLIQQFVRAAT